MEKHRPRPAGVSTGEDAHALIGIDKPFPRRLHLQYLKGNLFRVRTAFTMKNLIRLATFLLLPLLALSIRADQSEGPLDPAKPVGITPEEVIQRFAAKEKEFKQARERYTFRQTVKVQAMDGDTVKGEYAETFDVLADDQGRRVEHVVFAPQSSIEQGGLTITKEDLSDLRDRLPFVLTSDEVREYDILYIGQQQQDELHTYVFDIAPKQIEKGKRYFQGRIWVDDHDFQIVKTNGKTVPDIRKKNKYEENLFPAFTTWREQIDGKYWFPTYTLADDTLHFSGGDIRIREILRYENYKRFGSNSRIIYEGEELPKGQTPPDPDKKPH